jgi:hypothetical protein
MNQPPAYTKLPAYYFGERIRPVPCLPLTEGKKVRVYFDGFDDARASYVCASYERVRFTTSQVLLTFCQPALGGAS